MAKYTKKQNVVIIIYSIVYIVGVILLACLSKNYYAESMRLDDLFDNTQDTEYLRISNILRYEIGMYFFWFVSGMIVIDWWLDFFILKTETIKTKANLILFIVLTLVQAAVCYGFVWLISIDHFLHFGYAYMLAELAIMIALSWLSSVFKKKSEQVVKDK